MTTISSITGIDVSRRVTSATVGLPDAPWSVRFGAASVVRSKAEVPSSTSRLAWMRMAARLIAFRGRSSFDEAALANDRAGSLRLAVVVPPKVRHLRRHGFGIGRAGPSEADAVAGGAVAPEGCPASRRRCGAPSTAMPPPWGSSRRRSRHRPVAFAAATARAEISHAAANRYPWVKLLELPAPRAAAKRDRREHDGYGQARRVRASGPHSVIFAVAQSTPLMALPGRHHSSAGPSTARRRGCTSRR